MHGEIYGNLQRTVAIQPSQKPIPFFRLSMIARKHRHLRKLAHPFIMQRTEFVKCK